MIDRDEQPSLFGYPVVTTDDLATPEIVLEGVRFREELNPALADRAAFVRYHVEQIVKKSKTVASRKCEGKLLLEKAEASGDTGAGDEARERFLAAEQAQLEIDRHLAALIARTRMEP